MGRIGWFIFLVFAFFGGYFLRSEKLKTEPDPVKLINAIDALKGEYGFSKSSLEWVAATIGLTPKSHLKHSIVRTAVMGVVVAKTSTLNSLPILSRHYYVGAPGTYEFAGSLTLTSAVGETKVYHFSPRRMEFMKVFSLLRGKEMPAKFADITANNVVEIEETVDLAQSNVNDENLISITVRIIK